MNNHRKFCTAWANGEILTGTAPADRAQISKLLKDVEDLEEEVASFKQYDTDTCENNYKGYKSIGCTGKIDTYVKDTKCRPCRTTPSKKMVSR